MLPLPICVPDKVSFICFINLLLYLNIILYENIKTIIMTVRLLYQHYHVYVCMHVCIVYCTYPNDMKVQIQNYDEKRNKTI